MSNSSVAYKEPEFKKEVNGAEDIEDVKSKFKDIFCNIPVNPPARQCPKTTAQRKIKQAPIIITPTKNIPPSKIIPPFGSINIQPAAENGTWLTELEKQRYKIITILLNSNATPIKKHCVDSGYYCCFCKASFTTPADLKTHTINEHDDQNKNKFMKKIFLFTILKLDITKLSCNICNVPLDNVDELVCHLNSVHKKGLHTDIKSYIAAFKFNGEETKCHICGNEYRNFKVLLEHMNKHSKNFICDECGVSYINLGQLKTHSITHASGTFKCTTCEKVFKSNLNLQMHIRQIHSGKPVYKCNHCKDRFKSIQTKRNHLIKAHGIVFAESECNLCKRTFKTLHGLRLHKRRDHLMERRHMCNICERTFFSATGLKNHEKTHTGQKDFKCDVCSKMFSRKYALTEHMRSHTGDRRFKCSYCDMAFLQKCSLKGHLRTRHDAELQ